MNNKRFMILEKKVSNFFLALVLVFFMGSFLCMNIFDDFDENPIIYIGVTVIVGAILGVVVSVISKNQYFQILDDGFEIIEGDNVTKYDLSDFVGSNVVKHYTNGIPTGTTREIKLKKPNEKEVVIEINNLSQKEFSELVSYLGKHQYEQSHDEEIPGDVFKERKDFYIPGQAIIKENMKTLALYASLGGLCAIVGVGITCFLNDLMVYGVLGIAGAIVLGILEILPWLKRYNSVKSIPDKVSIDEWMITFDNKVFMAEEITNISMVPSTYEILTRDCIITTRNGEKHTYNFGFNGKKPKYTYRNYKDLNSAIHVWCIAKKISFMSILG